MCLWPSTTPGSVSTSRSRSVSFCFCAKLRTWAWANLMSSRSRFFIAPMARSISCGVSLNDSGAQLSNFCDSSRTAMSLRASISARMCSTVSRTLASAALIALASIPRLRWRGIGDSSITLPCRGRVGAKRRGGDLQRRTAPPGFATLAALPLQGRVRLFDRLRIDRRAGAAGDDQRRAAEKEFVDAVLVAILGKLLEIEDLAHAQPHGRDHHPVPRLVGFRGLVRPHLDAPGVGADRRDLLLLAPVAILEFHARRVAAGIAAPLLLGHAAFHLPGADEHEIAAADGDVLVLGAFVELVVGNAFAVGHPLDAAEARDVEQHAAADHLVLGMLDAEHVETLGIDQPGVVAVIALVLVEDVAERIPVGGALHAQHQRVVGIADAVPVLAAGDGVGAGRQHLVDRIEAAAEQAVLRAVGVERNAERENLAGANEACRLDDILRRDVVERSDVIVLAPAAPVLQLFRRLGDRFLADLDVHRTTPVSPGVFSRGGQRAAEGCAASLA